MNIRDWHIWKSGSSPALSKGHRADSESREAERRAHVLSHPALWPSHPATPPATGTLPTSPTDEEGPQPCSWEKGDGLLERGSLGKPGEPKLGERSAEPAQPRKNLKEKLGPQQHKSYV